jgi:hypothetical protein
LRTEDKGLLSRLVARSYSNKQTTENEKGEVYQKEMLGERRSSSFGLKT